MPQMSPLNWLFLYMYMLMILMIVNIILSNLFLSKSKMDYKKKIKSIKMFKWMW